MSRIAGPTTGIGVTPRDREGPSPLAHAWGGVATRAVIFQQFVLESLGHASYLLGSESTGEALVLDVRRDVETYFEAARRSGLRIAYAADSHQHNDYVTGICELPDRGEVQLLASARAELAYPARRLGDGDRVAIGEILIEVLQTPGHTPEHISLLVTDRSRGEEPALLLSGGALLVGDVARPDLLGGHEQTREMASAMWHTLQDKILTLPDHVEVYPTHVAGSLCGGAIGTRFSTTIGYERRLNHLLSCITSEERFVTQCLDLHNLPAIPPYWRRTRRLNQQGPPRLGVLPEPPALPVDEFARLHDEGSTVVDCRAPEAYGGAHIPGAIHVGLGASFPKWAGSVLPVDRSLLLVLEHASDLWEVCWSLLRIGYDLPKGWLGGGMYAWRTSGRKIGMLPQWTVYDLRQHLGQERDLVVLDVRQPQEWASGHIRGARHITGAQLLERAAELPTDRPIAVVCSSGYRSSVAASVLTSRGHAMVANVLGGMMAWSRAGFPLADGNGGTT
jgi:hydroxyacylglutathione hydrolase